MMGLKVVLGADDQQISAEATSRVLPSELTHHVTLMTANCYINAVIMLNGSVLKKNSKPMEKNESI